MDTLMDKLAQKLNAQEMIRANGEAEAEQMQYLKAQVGEYQGCLDRLQQVCNELGSLENRLADLSLPGTSASEEAVSEIKNQIETLAQSTDNQLKELSNNTNSQLREFSDSTNSKLRELSDSTGRKLDEISESTDSRFKDFSEATNRQLKDMQGELLEKVGTEENLHKEGVRIYKNIQASMVNELEPLEDDIKDAKKEILASIKGVKVLAVVAVIISALTLAIQIIKLLGIL